MGWTTVSANLSFDEGSWGVVDDRVSGMDSTTAAGIRSDLQNMYNNNSTGDLQSLLEGADFNIRIAQMSQIPGITEFGSVKFVAVNLEPNDIFMNDHGKMVNSTVDLNLVHELDHLLADSTDPSDTDPFGSGEAVFDDKGDAVRMQNEVAHDMGWTDEVQASYFGSAVVGDARAVQLQMDSSYSDDHHVDISIIDSAATNDVIDLSQRPNDPAIVMLGLDGNDTLTSGTGDDWVYGGAGDDSLSGLGGNDHLYGEGGNDIILGGDGNDTINGGAKPGQTIGGDNGVDSLYGGQGDDFITAGSSSDDLIYGNAGNDKIVVLGQSATIDGGQGDDVIDATGAQTDAGPTSTVVFGDDSGHDYIVIQHVPDPDSGPPVSVSNIMTIDMSSLTHDQVSLDFDKTYVSTWGPYDDFPGIIINYYQGDAVIVTPDGSTLYIGNVQEDIGNANGPVEYGFMDETGLLFRFSDGEYYLSQLFTDESHVSIGSVASYLHAPDAWA